MNYTEVTIECKNTDETCDRLTALGVDGFVIENEDDFKAFLENNRQYWDYVDSSLEESYKGVSRVKFYVEDNEDGARLLDFVKAEFEVKTAPVCDADWENNWKEYYKPLEIGEKLLVVPEWIDCAEVGEFRCASTPVCCSEPARMQQRACALPRSKSTQGRASAPSTSAAAAVSSA